ncbi:arylsulfatase [Flammeovirga sp. EKP202]|uniref:arylsulfatase n=1 Tax=Flammeovirga sp. EKP202 TaxID=2770592 RepID=UPI00165FA949|nr:arylsulfatase [Flammeovirga sp. EKP202]MBD0405188.1 arylsulfatase [Flammeovirga sp. EKP202]
MKKILLIINLLLLLVISRSCFAQEEVLPKKWNHFNGKIERTFTESEEDYPQPIQADEKAPNIILVILDDVGFGQSSTFGGPIATPHLDKVAEEGISYTQFHTTGVCSATRAALLTGRNHHQTGFGTISEMSTGFPGYNSIWDKDAASVAEVLKENGYNTAAWGKWHNTPDWETSQTGPFDRWPTGLGFEYFYGFIGGETSQYEPQLYKNTIAVEPNLKPEDGYHLTEDLSKDAIHWIQQQQSLNPDKPYFAYFSTGAIHAPLHVQKEWIEKYKGKFDEGWDKMREETIKRQIEMGIVPEGTKLTERPDAIESWESQTEEQKKLYARQMEVVAGYLAHTDHYIGELLKEARSLPGGENTMVIYVVGDNGASGEGTPMGTINNMMVQNGFPDSLEDQLKVMDELGSKEFENHYAVPWAWAGCAPFQWMKRVPSHFGGTRNGLVISWPEGLKSKNEKRTQFHHVVDIAPTIYEAAKIKTPSHVNGVEQTPMAGVPMNYSFESEEVESTRKIQYFEVGGHHAIYHDGWVASAFHGVPWKFTGSVGFDSVKWELYNVEEDFSQSTDLADKYPEKLAELIELFDEEAKKYNVYPLDDRYAERALNPLRPSITRGKKYFKFYQGTTRIPEGGTPPVYSKSHTIQSALNYSKGDEGVIVAVGGNVAGYSMYIQGNKLHYTYNFFNKERYKVSSSIDLPEGEITVKMRYEQESEAWGGGGTATLYINNKAVGKTKINKTVPIRFAVTETTDIGMDLGSQVSKDYIGSFEYTNSIQSVEYFID